MSHDWLKKKEVAVAAPTAQRERDGAYIIYVPWNQGHKKLIQDIKNVCNHVHLQCSALNAFANPTLMRRFHIDSDTELPAVVVVANGVNEKFANIDNQLNNLKKRVQYQ